MTLNYVNITETFDDGSQTGLNGSATFTPSQTVYAAGVPVVSASNPIGVQIAAGTLEPVKLLATDNTGLSYLSGTGFFFWTVTVTLNGVQQAPFSFFLPHSPSTVELYSLANTAAGGASVTFPITLAEGGTGFNAVSIAALLDDLGALDATENLADLVSAATARTNLGLGTAALINTPVSIANGGTGQTSAQAALNALAGAVTAGQFLRGNGTNVLLSAIAATDLPSILTTFTFGSSGAVPASGTYAAGAFAIDQNGIFRVCTASGTPGTWARAGAQPGDFHVDDYGAKGDGVKVLVTTVAGNAQITAATSVFNSGTDVGKNLMICGAGGAVPGGPQVDTIASVQSGTQATLTGNIPAGGSGSGLACVFSSDDRTAIDSCISAAQTYAVTHGYFARVLFSNKIYGLGTGLYQSSAGVSGATLSYNTQVRMAVGTDLTGESGKLEVQYLGPTAGAQCRFWTAVTEDAPGAVLMSYSVGPNSADGTFGQQAMMQMPIGGTGISNDAGFFNVKAVVKGLTFVQPGWSNSVGLDLYTAAEHDISVTSSVFAPSTNEGGGVNPYIGWFNQSFWINNKIGTGVRLSKAQQNDQCESDICVQGLNVGVVCEADHVIIKRLSIAAVDTAMKMNVGGNTQHNITANVSAENYNNGLVVSGSGSRVQCEIIWDAEMTTGTIAGNDIGDAASQLFGTFRWSDFSRSTAGTLAGIIIPTVSGAANLHILNDQLTRQVYDAHSYAYTLGAAFQNPWWGHMWVQLSGGTVSNVQIGPTSSTCTTSVATSTPCTFKLPSGWWLNITGSVKPTTFNAVPD